MKNANDHIEALLDRCQQGDRRAQESLYHAYFRYGMTVCLHYSSGYDEAREIFNDAMLHVFTRLCQFDRSKQFRPWLRRILINAAIDNFRRTNRPLLLPIEGTPEQSAPRSFHPAAALLEDDVLRLVQQLPASYRTIFNLYVIEGMKHAEIADSLGITEGASKNLFSKARNRLQAMLSSERQAEQILQEKTG